MIETFTCEQNSEDWYRVRSGMPTASEFHTVLARGVKGGESITRRKYMYQLAGEIITGEPSESYTNFHMERGKVLEAEARSLYAFMQDVDPEIVGFIRSDKPFVGRVGCSPDALIGTSGMAEIKTAIPAILIDRILRGEFPPEHKAQCQGSLWVAERQWIDIVMFWRPKLPLFVQRIYRDDDYIKNLESAVATFHEELAVVVERVRNYTPGQSVAAE